MADRTTFLTANLASVLVDRTLPTITTWNRLEGRPRTANFDRALKAEVRDALWMLTRQWQFGEFHGDDAGSPIAAKIRMTTTRLRKYRAGENGPIEPFDDTVPLETKVERRPVVFSLDLQLSMGRQWLKMLHLPDLNHAFIDQYRIHKPDPLAPQDAIFCAHAEVWDSYAAVAGRRMNGAALYRHLIGGGHAWDGIAGVAGREAQIDAAADRFVAWFEKLIAQPADSNAWAADRLEYQFACSAPAENGEKVFVADEYYQGHLDWYSVDFDRPPTLGNPAAADPANPTAATRVVMPANVTFNGMPNTRHWTYEDGATNFGDIKPDTTDLGKLLLIEFGLIYANDWFIVPYTLPAGTVAHVDGVAVTNVFGERTWVLAAGRGIDDDWQRWAMFLVNTKGNAGERADTSLLLLPVAAKVDEGRPLEEVMLVRDEVANMVWAIENTIPLPTGEPKRGVEAARELRARIASFIVPPPPPPAPVAAIRYEVMNTVPENWIPFIPVHRPGDNRSVQLQRAAMPRIIPGDPNRPAKVRPRTSLLREGLEQLQPYFIHEEVVSRAGTLVKQQYQRTRWRDGRAWVWLGVRRQTGRGEVSSGLAFDRIIDQPKS
jgi:hypothetical protein